jgi:hypothetical protein
MVNVAASEKFPLMGLMRHNQTLIAMAIVSTIRQYGKASGALPITL